MRGWGEPYGWGNRAEQGPPLPEGVERAGVQQGQQLGLGTGEAEAVVQGLERWHHQGRFPLAAQLQLLDGGPDWGAPMSAGGEEGSGPSDSLSFAAGPKASWPDRPAGDRQVGGCCGKRSQPPFLSEGSPES